MTHPIYALNPVESAAKKFIPAPNRTRLCAESVVQSRNKIEIRIRKENEMDPIYAIVSLYGHTVLAGKISEITIAGVGFIKIEIPAVPPDHNDPEPIKAHDEIIGTAAIFGMEPTTEQAMFHCACQVRHVPAEERYPAPKFPEGEKQEQLEYGIDSDSWRHEKEDSWPNEAEEPDTEFSSDDDDTIDPEIFD